MAAWLCKDSRPSQLVEDKAFKNFLGILKPEYEVPCKSTMASCIRNIYGENRKIIEEKLEKVEFVAIKTDGGSSSNTVSF